MSKLISAATAFLAGGMPEKTVPRAMMAQLECSQEEAEEAVAKAIEEIVKSADFDREKEMGNAIQLTRQVITRTVSKDPRTALAAQRELNKLLGLYKQKDDGSAAEDPDQKTNDDLYAIAAHLIPLGLAPRDYPLVEHARIAAEKIRSMNEEG